MQHNHLKRVHTNLQIQFLIKQTCINQINSSVDWLVSLQHIGKTLIVNNSGDKETWVPVGLGGPRFMDKG